MDNGNALDLSDLFLDALLDAKTGDMGAAEEFADQLLAIFNSSADEEQLQTATDDAYTRLASSLGVLEGADIRGVL